MTASSTPLYETPPSNFTSRIFELDSARNLLLLRVVSWGIAFAAGLLQTWAARFSITPDGTSYLDIASAYLRGDWHNALNSFWSPFFSWLLALAFWIFHPSPYWESTLLHLLNFLGFLLALLSFEFLLRSFLLRAKRLPSTENSASVFPQIAWWILGYGLFLSTTLFLLPAGDTTPDIWISALTYIAAGLILRIHISACGWRLFALLGFTLALAYLTKSFYFPMTFVFLSAAWMAAGNFRRVASQVTLALMIFLAVAGPWIYVLSRSRHRLTFGDAGKLNFAIFVDRISQFFFWQGENGSGTPTHPVRQLLAHPRVFEFASPIAGTYPPAFDLPYWMDGVRLRFNLHAQLAVLRQSFGTFFRIFQSQLEYAVLFLALFFGAAGRAVWWDQLRRQSYFWLPPLVACFSYSLVLVEFRYVAPFVLLLWLAAISTVAHATPQLPRRFVLTLFLAAVSVTGLKVVKFAVTDFFAIRSNHENADWEVAQGLHHLSLQPGDKVSAIALGAQTHWARLAGLQIVAEIPLGDDYVFWASAPQAKQQVFRLLASSGAKFLIAKDPPLAALGEGWIPLGNTSFYAHPLDVRHP